MHLIFLSIYGPISGFFFKINPLSSYPQFQETFFYLQKNQKPIDFRDLKESFSNKSLFCYALQKQRKSPNDYRINFTEI